MCIWRALEQSMKILDSDTLLILNSILLLGGYGFNRYLEIQTPPSTNLLLVRGVILFGCVKAVCPILQTLTRTFSDDTVMLLSTSET